MASWNLHIEHLKIHLDYLAPKCVDHVENEWLPWVGGSSCVLLPEKKVKLWWGWRSCLSVESRSKTRSRPFGTEVNSASTWGRPQNSLHQHKLIQKNQNKRNCVFINLVKHEEPSLHQPNGFLITSQPLENCSTHIVQVFHRTEWILDLTSGHRWTRTFERYSILDRL